MSTSGWYRDPTGQADGRYWDGERWSDQAERDGVAVTLPIDASAAQTPPVPGSEYVSPARRQAATPEVQPAKTSVVGPVIGAIAVVVAVIALVVALSNNSDDDTEEEPTTTTEAETPETTAEADAPADE